MGRRKSPKNAILSYIGNVGKCAAVFYSTSAAIAYYGDKPLDLVWPGLAAIAAPALVGFKMPTIVTAPDVSLGFVTAGHSLPRPGGLFQSLTRWSVGGYNNEPPPDYQTRTIRYDESIRGQYYWRVRLRNRNEVYFLVEDIFRRFVHTVARRQRTGHPHPFSRNDLTPRPFGYRDYEASINVLIKHGLIINRVGGSSGRLYPENMRATYFVVEYCKHRPLLAA
jgi:hypothetical protein